MEVPRATPRSSEPVKPRLSTAGLTALRSPDAGKLSPPPWVPPHLYVTRQRDCKASPCSCVLGLLRRTLATFSITPSPSLFHSTFLAVCLRTQAAKPANGEMEGAGSDISDWGRVLSLTPQSHATPPPPVDRVKTKWFLPGN